jgi:secondary thiamine-phosphate synthase enzyme
MVSQYEIELPAFPRGFHLIDTVLLAQLPPLPDTGLFQVFIRHTSAGICINENADPTVLLDFETVFNRLVPEGMPYYRHRAEGDDDMPAHIKSVLAGSSVSIPITDGKLNLGTWQGIYLCEFRNHGGRRKVVVTILS